VEQDGSITVLGRGSASINTGGEKVYPDEVEAALKDHPAVFDAIVVGIPDERFGARVAAVVALREPGSHEEIHYGAVLERHLRERLSGYRVPRSWSFVERCPRLITGKADYRGARAVAQAEGGPA
jgi:3-oxocholest-4-en-26-oate---CoA ligase